MDEDLKILLKVLNDPALPLFELQVIYIKFSLIQVWVFSTLNTLKVAAGTISSLCELFYWFSSFRHRN